MSQKTFVGDPLSYWIDSSLEDAQSFEEQSLSPDVRADIEGHFPLCHADDFDNVYFKDGWPIGLKSSSGLEFRRRVYAGGLSHMLQLSSIDYTLKRYVPTDLGKDSTSETENRGEQINVLIRNNLKLYKQNHKALGRRVATSAGLFAADLNLVRFEATIVSMLSCANRGFLFESLALARFGLEQLAWIWFAHDKTEDVFILAEANRCVASLKSVYPTTGRLYGHLSRFTHWSPSEHWRFAAEDRQSGMMASIIASSYYKMLGLVHTLLASDISLCVFENIHRSDIVERKVTTSDYKPSPSRESIHMVEELCKHYSADGNLRILRNMLA